MKRYAGIGSRTAPMNILEKIRNIAQTLAHKGYICSTGGALGCDKAFIDGTQIAGKYADLWLPWQYYNGYYTDNPDVEERHLEFRLSFFLWNRR